MAEPRHAVLLCWAAGFVDAIGYFELDQVFTANMTGNTVLLFAALGGSEWYQSITYLIAVAAFTTGATIGVGLKHWTGHVESPLWAVAALVAAAALMQLPLRPEIALLSFAMGLQGASVSRFAGARLQTVVLTGTLVNLADRVVAALFRSGQEEPDTATTVPLLVGVWLAYGLGAAAAALASRVTDLPLLLPAMAVLIAAVDLLRLRWRSGLS